MLDARLLAFRVGAEHDPYLTPEDIESMAFRVESEEAFNPEQKQVRLLLNVWIDAHVRNEPDAEPDQAEATEYKGIGFCRIGFVFTMDNYEELIQPAENFEEGMVVDATAMAHLFAMAYSTSRGMILVKTRGTSLEGSLLPIIDPMVLMDKEG